MSGSKPARATRSPRCGPMPRKPAPQGLDCRWSRMRKGSARIPQNCCVPRGYRPRRASRDAGSYLCNYLSWRAIEAVERRERPCASPPSSIFRRSHAAARGGTAKPRIHAGRTGRRRRGDAAGDGEAGAKNAGVGKAQRAHHFNARPPPLPGYGASYPTDPLRPLNNPTSRTIAPSPCCTAFCAT